MKIQYFNVFLCRNGEKTNYDLSKLIDIIRVSSPIERTVKLGSQHTMFMNNSRIPLHHVTNGSSLEGYEYLPRNRTVWIGKYRSEKPYEGKIGEEEIKQIDGDLFEPNSDIDFLLYHLNNSRLFLRFSTMQKLGGTRVRLYYKNLITYKLAVPTVKEQQAIGSYFSKLDQLITSYREKITQLETLKKKLLQDMFI